MRKAALIAAAVMAGMAGPSVMTGGALPLRMRDPAPEPMPLSSGLDADHRNAPNGGRRHTVAQGKRAARKRRNQLRARGHHRQAVR